LGAGRVDFAGGQTRDPDGGPAPTRMGEVPSSSERAANVAVGAILIWLAETTGKFAPGTDERFEALRLDLVR